MKIPICIFIIIAVCVVSVLANERKREAFADEDICISGMCFSEKEMQSHIKTMDKDSKVRLANMLKEPPLPS